MHALNVALLEPLLDIKEVTPMNDRDKPLMEEMSEVLKRHNAQSRFGIVLLHKHFDVGDDEVLVEYTDRKTRKQTIEVEKRADINWQAAIETTWRLDEGQAIMACVCINDGADHSHQSRHSDANLKENVENIKYGLKEVLQMRPVSYSYASDKMKLLSLPSEPQLGFVAQEMNGIVPEVVVDNLRNTKYMGLDYISLVPVLVAAIQEQQKQIDALTHQN